MGDYSVYIVPLVTGLLGILGSWLAMRTQKAPDVQTAFSKATTDILEQYRLTLDRLDATVTELRDEVTDLNEHIDVLTAALRQHGIQPPQRKKRAAAA